MLNLHNIFQYIAIDLFMYMIHLYPFACVRCGECGARKAKTI